MLGRNTKYDHMEVEWIINGLDRGEYIIPTFQRDYEWETTRIVNFLNSMIDKEPFGYIVIWRNKNAKELCDSRNVILNKYKQNISTKLEVEYLIDGQQRLTTCFILKKWNDICNDFEQWNKAKKSNDEYKQLKEIYKKFKEIHLNLDSMKFEILKTTDKKINHIELRLLSKCGRGKDLIKELNQEEMILKYKSKDELEDKIDKAIDLFKEIFSMQLGCVVLTNYALHEVIEIFQNMNTKGKPLTIFDLLHSKWYEHNINLDNEFRILIAELDTEWEKLSKDVFIDVLYFILNKDKPIIKNKDKLEFNLDILIKDGDNSILEKSINNAIDSIKRATQFLSTNKFNKKNIPSEIIIKWLSYFFYKKPKITSAKDQAFILYYISIISINHRYSSSTTSKLEKDLHILNLLLNDDIKSITKEINDEFSVLEIDENTIVHEKYTSPSMTSKFLIWRLTNESFDPYSNNKITNMDSNKVDLHHVFPKNMKDKSIFKDNYNPDSIVNIWPIAKETNQMVSNYRPSQYIDKLMKGNNFTEILKNVGISINHLQNDDFEGMIENRKDWFRDKINCYIKELRDQFIN